MKLGLSLAVIAGINILVAFVYQWYVITALGPGRDTDALFAGAMVPQLVLVITSGSLSYVLVPLLAVATGADRSGLAWTYFHGIGALALGLVLLLMLSAPLWVPLAVPGFSAEATRLTVHLTRIQLLGAVLTAVSGVEFALHHAEQRFLLAEGAAVLASLAGLGFLIWGLPRIGIEAAAWATIVRAGAQMLLLLPGMGRYRAPRWNDPALALGLRRAAPLIGGQLYYKSDGLLDRFLASMAPPGALSLYHLSQQLYASGSMVLNRAIVAPAVPQLSRLASLGDWPSFTGRITRQLTVMLAVAAVGSAGMALAGRPLLALTFGHGEFSPDQVDHLWWLLLLLSGVWIGGTVGQILSTSFYAQGDTRTPARVGVVGFTLAVLLKLLAFRQYGIEGLALAASAYYLLNATVLLALLRRRMRRATEGTPR